MTTAIRSADEVIRRLPFCIHVIHRVDDQELYQLLEKGGISGNIRLLPHDDCRLLVACCLFALIQRVASQCVRVG
jgi:hypothetical protein